MSSVTADAEPALRPAAPAVFDQPAVGWWLLAVCALVWGMVLVGGATRLTDSGLSITDWNLAKQLWPPMTAQAWEHEFALYRQTAEYQLQNRGMSLADFQYIYAWEWGHRFLGKVVGVAFAVPFFFFWATGRLKGRFWPILGMFALGGAQGALGWWMVAGGLDRLDVPSYRLASHLGMAFLILGVGVWLALDAFGWPKRASQSGPKPAVLGVFAGLVFLQIVLGALVAGIDAGRKYADWPTIGGEWLPKSYAAIEPFWRNIFENEATTQFHHRGLAYVIAAMAVWLFLAARKASGPTRTLGLITVHLVAAQVVLGIVTVMNAAPLGLALVHQGLAVAVWVASIAWWRASLASRNHWRYHNTASQALGAEGQTQRA